MHLSFNPAPAVTCVKTLAVVSKSFYFHCVLCFGLVLLLCLYIYLFSVVSNWLLVLSINTITIYTLYFSFGELSWYTLDFSGYTNLVYIV